MNKIIFGIHAVETMNRVNPQNFQEIFILNDHDNNRLNLLYISLKKRGVKINLVNRQLLETKVKKGVIHQGIIAIIKSINQFKENFLQNIIQTVKKPFLLVLDCITDSHNLGACIRTADAAGVHAVIVPKNRSASLNSTVQKVSSGASVKVPLIRVNNLSRTLCFLQEQNILIVGTANGSNNNLYAETLIPPIALVMGSENNGIRHLTSKYCNKIIGVPMHGIVSSLNVSVATGICLFEIIRQQQYSIAI
ncbi:23S rRNA (guanosine(2251)-2'-O)-methyltransferase RlmB [Candidatus Pantoea edessiphila]|uniref:23S rRNA (Guanosine(2251)-2'-O)-methyltransferase RlmB n=1 Tax=Candidatus Pantoea edessiphila TaxID=2044610 RepID=A0A2P5T1M9_9GAMM|nr:23S rRNA (guanosine(2251)-2'-O)-methyltransferase RlmB [Candidatus Pantoea edessiphila]PPI88501.1 23S rRNA (guanosine(2251)-2'-O)-methyltransferase RlmB [Candidatus Pantoea edessiphila]